MQPSTIASHLYVEDSAEAAPASGAFVGIAERSWGDRALIAAERRLLPPRARPMSRAAERGQGGLWFRSAAIFMMSLSAGLLGLNAFLLFNTPKTEAAAIAFDRADATSSTALPAPVAPAQGVVANAAGVGRIIIAEPLPVATLTTDAYTVVGNAVQASSSSRIAAGTGPASASSSAASDGQLAPLSAPVPVNMAPAMDPVTAEEARRNADEAMRVIAASTPSVDRTRARDPALIEEAATPQVEPSAAGATSAAWNAGVQ
jgi:hypothetical protein